MEGKRRAEVVVGAEREEEAGAGTAKGAGAKTRVVNESGAGAGTGDAVGAGTGDAAVPGAGSAAGASEQPCMYTSLQLGLTFFLLCIATKLLRFSSFCCSLKYFCSQKPFESRSQKNHVFFILVCSNT